MAKPAPTGILQAVRRAAEDPRLKDTADHDLLRRFTVERDEAAFQTLLRRHGPMVLSVCRAVLSAEVDAEDAFQATFLVLAHKAGSIRKANSLASWLHGVAHRTALKVRAESSKQMKHERHASVGHESLSDDPSWREVQQVVHEELGKLSERYRGPLTVCYLQGRTLDQAAAELGLAKGTLRVRLDRAREVLRARLVRRGLGPAAALLASAWPAVGDVPPALHDSTVAAGASVVAGQSLAPLVSARVATLTEGVRNTMFITKLKTAAAVLAMMTLTGLSLGGLAIPAPTTNPEPQQPDPDEKKPKVVVERIKDREDEEWLRVTSKVKVIDARTLELEDGTRVALEIQTPHLEQMGIIGETLYQCGKEAAEFLRRTIGDRPVTCYRRADRRVWSAYVGDTSLDQVMILNGWAWSMRAPLPGELIARENKLGLWRGKFTDPDDWAAGVRMPNEPPPPKFEDAAVVNRLLAEHGGREPVLSVLVERVVNDMPGIKRLEFVKAPLTTALLAKLGRLTALEELTLSGDFPDEALVNLKGMTRLKKLDLTHTNLTDAALPHLAHLIDLEDLTLSQQDGASITDAGLNHLKGLRKLRRLDLSHTQVTDAFLEHVGTLPDLHDLMLGWTPTTDLGLSRLKGLKGLRRLTLHYTQITDAGVAHLSGHRGLMVLEIGRTKITNACLRHVKELVNLVYLDIAPSEVTNAGIEQLYGLKRLKIIHVPQQITEPVNQRLLAELPELRNGVWRVEQVYPGLK